MVSSKYNCIIPELRSRSNSRTLGGCESPTTLWACSALSDGIPMSCRSSLSSAAPSVTDMNVLDGLVAIASTKLKISSRTSKLKYISITAAFSVIGVALEKLNVIVGDVAEFCKTN